MCRVKTMHRINNYDFDLYYIYNLTTLQLPPQHDYYDQPTAMMDLKLLNQHRLQKKGF